MRPAIMLFSVSYSASTVSKGNCGRNREVMQVFRAHCRSARKRFADPESEKYIIWSITSIVSI